jgi:flagellar basal-body rod modification protein FlgD
MSQVSSIAAGNPNTATSGSQDLRNVDVDQFLKLLVTELQNQDPLDPLDNSQLLQQISLIRDISATDKLSDTLDAVHTGQNLATASGLIGKQIRALTDSAENINGVVDRVSVETSGDDSAQRILRVHVGDHDISLENIREIVTPVE